MSRFVSAGTDGEPDERDEAWLKAQEKIEATKRATADIGRQDAVKSLYETLQANKAAKQDAFEESIRLSNQFQSLNEDEVEFLDAVLQEERAKEAAVKRQTAEELDAFRKQREDAEKAAKLAATTQDPQEAAVNTSWTVGKKRKKAREGILGGAKLRKSSTGDRALPSLERSSEPSPKSDEPVKPMPADSVKLATSPSKATKQVPPFKEATAAPKSPSPATAPIQGLGLGAYSSDED